MKPSTVVLALCALAAPLFAGTNGRYIVMTRPSARAAQVGALQTEAATDADLDVREFRTIEGFAATLSPAEVAKLRRSPDVRFVSPVVETYLLDGNIKPVRYRGTTTISSFQKKQTVPYGIDLIHARDVWAATRGFSTSVNVAILDTGIDYNHPELIAAYRGGYNVMTKDTPPFDDNFHGTHVAGTIAAADNDIGVVGVAPAANVWSVKVLDRGGNGTDEGLVVGIDWVISQKRALGGNWIISMSLGSKSGSPAEEEVLRQAVADGILVVSAAGNHGAADIEYPAKYPGILTVGAIDSGENFARFSNHGPRLDVVAPGVSVLSTLPVGSVSIADVTVASTALSAVAVNGSPRADVTAPVVFCDLGKVGDFPPNVRGSIALVRRGEILFNEKVRNAKAAGAVAVIIIARSTDGDDRDIWTLIRPCDGTCDDHDADLAFDWPLTVALKYDDGESVRNATGPVDASSRADDYGELSGTSMSTPHVTGVAALLWSLAPSLTADDVKLAILSTTHDLGGPGYDEFFGFGEVDAFAAAKKVAPAAFGLPDPPPPQTSPVRRRSMR